MPSILTIAPRGLLFQSSTLVDQLAEPRTSSAGDFSPAGWVVGASAAVLDRGQFAVGVNNITDLLRPLTRGRVKVVAEPIHQGATQQLWQVIISKADDGKVLARGQVRLQNVSLDRRKSMRCRGLAVLTNARFIDIHL